MIADTDRKTVTRWIEDIKTRFRVEIPDIANAGKVSPSTIYRWLDENHPFNPSMTTLRKIARAYNVPMPGERIAQHFPGSDEMDVHELGPGEIGAGVPRPEGNQAIFAVTSRSMELAGYLPGDYLTVDMKASPRPGDIVCAQVFNIDRGRPEMKLRRFDPPYLTTHTMHSEVADRPLFLDNERVLIVGTVVRSTRIRAA